MVALVRAVAALVVAAPFVSAGCFMVMAPQRAHDLFRGSHYEDGTFSPRGYRGFQIRGAAVVCLGILVGIVAFAGSG